MNANVIWDGGDVEGDGEDRRWYGEEMGCLECREVAPMRTGATPTYMVAELCCGECGEPFAEYQL